MTAEDFWDVVSRQMDDPTRISRSSSVIHTDGDEEKVKNEFLRIVSGYLDQKRNIAHSTLARIQDRCSSFAQHIFAISGIWAAALFNRLAYKNAPNDKDTKCEPSATEKGLFQQKVDSLLNEDFLSPIVGVGLFPNLFQLIWPYSIKEINRSAIFESLIAKSWGSTPDNAFMATVFDSWDAQRPEFAVGLRYEHASDRVRTVRLFPERKRQFAEPPLHPIRFDIRKVLAVHAEDLVIQSIKAVTGFSFRFRV